MSRPAPDRFIYCPQSIARNFVEVSSDMVSTPTRKLVIKWYRSSHVDLQVWLDHGHSKVIRQQFSYMGLVVEWNHIQGVRTGYLQDSLAGEEATNNAQVTYDKSIQKESVELVLEVMKLTEGISEKQEIINNYENSPKISKWQSTVLVVKHLLQKIKLRCNK